MNNSFRKQDLDLRCADFYCYLTGPRPSQWTDARNKWIKHTHKHTHTLMKSKWYFKFQSTKTEGIPFSFLPLIFDLPSLTVRNKTPIIFILFPTNLPVHNQSFHLFQSPLYTTWTPTHYAGPLPIGKLLSLTHLISNTPSWAPSTTHHMHIHHPHPSPQTSWAAPLASLPFQYRYLSHSA